MKEAHTCCLDVCYEFLSERAVVESLSPLFCQCPVGFCELGEFDSFAFLQDVGFIDVTKDLTAKRRANNSRNDLQRKLL